MQATLVGKREGIYCEAGNFFIDPQLAVERALITHAHSDHARRGSKYYLCHMDTIPLLRERLGNKLQIEGIPYGKQIRLGDAKVSFHPAGHILGSSQIRIETKAGVWVVSGDYKLQTDPTCQAFEPVRCDVFVTESTFGLPIYHWEEEEVISQRINQLWLDCIAEQKTMLVLAYSLGKTQRVLAGLSESLGNIYLEDPGYRITKIYQDKGILFPKHSPLSELRTKESSPFLICTPQTDLRRYAQHLGDIKSYFASGWLRSDTNNPFSRDKIIMSDHADWNGLLQAIRSTQAEKVLVMHGFCEPLVSYLQTLGIQAEPFIFS
ncbi:putative exonuclease [Leptospira ryugenii]|uniref:Putative exonuclease n=1 Tax=Leptospira ryugenii TaxID=1917863 RepID=A0A2P2DYZ7_9LEPT|nr:ligase-associated DNA damage response exonuclease [Leptospira ryugenii]GBF49857.1 putative exonuclease [Leptospira ryugenii]